MRIKNGFVLREVAGQPIVVATGEASKEFHGMVKLNQTGKDIWQGLMEGLTEEQIVEKLAEHYQVTKEKAAEDTRKLLGQMEQAGFLLP